jgi:hypothetical protein
MRSSDRNPGGLSKAMAEGMNRNSVKDFFDMVMEITEGEYHLLGYDAV